MVSFNTILLTIFLGILALQLVSFIVRTYLPHTPSDNEMAPGLTEISSTAQLDGILREAPPSQLVVMGESSPSPPSLSLVISLIGPDFHAVWCGPCHAVAPVYAQLANKYSHVKFLKVDVDKQQEIARRYRISAMPTFKFLKGGKEVGEVKGANPPALNSLVAQHAGPVPAPSAPVASGSTASSAKPVDSTTSLLSHITSKGLSCLNESSSHPLSSILGSSAGPRGSSYLESDVDPELLIAIPFNESVKLKAVSIFGGVCPSQAPKSVTLYVNQLSMDFGDADKLEAAQSLELTAEQIKGERVDLRFVRFQTVRSLHILVKSNQEDEETTRIDSIELFGTCERLDA